MYTASLEMISDEDLSELAKWRRLPGEAFRDQGIGFDGSKYKLPSYTFERKIIDLRYCQLKEKWFSSTGGKAKAIIGSLELASYAGKSVFVCEGPWDMLALRWLLKKNEREGLVVALPSATGWDREFTRYFQGKDVYLCFDFDRAGKKGANEVGRSLNGVASSVHYVHWPEGLKEGYDVNDFISEHAVAERKPRTTLRRLTGFFQIAPHLIAGEVPALTAQNDSTGLGINRRGINFNPISAAELLRQKPVERVWVWYGHIPEGGLVLLAAAPKTGKSTLAYHLVKAVVQGHIFLGHPTRKCNVLVLACEEHSEDVAERIKELEIPPENLTFNCGFLKSTSPELNAIEQTIREKQVGLVIIDTLSKFWTVTDENNAVDVIKNIEPILELARRTKAGILIIHHLRKSPGEDGTAIRGSGALFGAVDVAFTLTRRKDAINQRLLDAFSRYKQTPLHSVIGMEDGNYRSLGSKDAVVRTDNEVSILKVLSDRPKDAKEIGNAAGVRAQTTRDTLERLLENKTVARIGTGMKNNPYRYTCLKNGSTEPDSLGRGINSGPKRAIPLHLRSKSTGAGVMTVTLKKQTSPDNFDLSNVKAAWEASKHLNGSSGK